MQFFVITPTFNRPDQLARCLAALQAQTYKQWQVWVINDGSSVDYSAIQPFLADPRTHYLAQAQNQGVNAARNVALTQLPATADAYVCLVDDDEYLIPDAFALAQHSLLQSPTEWLVLQCFLNQEQLTYMAYSGEMDYIDDYLYGKNLKKDATHFIHLPLALKARFTTWIKNGDEWVYFAQLARYSRFRAETLPVKYNYHQADGLFLSKSAAKKSWRAYALKLYRPWLAVRLRPKNRRAWQALLVQVLKLPLRLPQMALASLRQSQHKA